MSRVAFLAYGLLAYALFLIAILYGIAFLANAVVPKTVDGPMAAANGAQGALVDVLLLGAFALQHNVMARPLFKRWWTRIVPPAIERSTYVAAASLLLLLLYWQWRP